MLITYIACIIRMRGSVPLNKCIRNLILQQFQVRELGEHIIGQLREIIGGQIPICLKLRE